MVYAGSNVLWNYSVYILHGQCGMAKAMHTQDKFAV